MSKVFDAAFNYAMRLEGGAIYHEIKGDQGGATKYGISLRFLKGLGVDEADIDGDGHVSRQDIKALDEQTAKFFYLRYFWLYYQLGDIENPQAAIKLFSIYINMRGKTATLVAQRALSSCRVPGIIEDGYIGPITIAAINEICCCDHLTAVYLVALRSHQEAVYRLIAAKNPSQTKFLNGWINRARDNFN